MPDSKTEVRCRFAPSPTGYLHVGGARTALFNYLFAKRHNGKFILRIEDTDLQRSTNEAVEAIFAGMRWLNLEWDEGPFFQTKRTPLYLDYAKELLRLGVAYPCSCTSEELDRIREEQRANNQKPQYNRKHRPLNQTPQSALLPHETNGEPFVIRLRAPTEGETVFQDQILGEIRTGNSELDDFILIRSDGSPTYNFTVVVDDIDMNISHVIRGMDHISNTPKQILLYQAFGKKPPEFAHVPMILGPDKKKLSKRHGATSVVEYKDEGFLADAFVNYLARLGWSHGDQEIFTREELGALFSLDHVGKSAAVFDKEKLLWVNQEHIKKTESKELAAKVKGILTARGVGGLESIDTPAFLKLLDTLKPRAKSLVEIADQCHWFFIADSELVFDEKAVSAHLDTAGKGALTLLTAKLKALDVFDEPSIEGVFKQVIESLNVKLVKLAQPARVALTGSTVSPPIYTVAEVLGKERTLARLGRAIGGS